MATPDTFTLGPRLKTGLSTAILIRTVEQKLLELFAQGKLFGTVHTCIGQEWVGVAVCEALLPADVVLSNHRCHGHFLARTGNVDGLIAEVMGKQTGVCAGRGGSQHLCDVHQGFFSNGVQGGMMPIAAGMALSAKLGADEAIAVVFIGDGTLGEGTVYEALNVASKWELPLLIVLENNGYAQSTAQRQTLAGNIEARAQAFGIPTRRSSTWDPEQLVDVAQACVQQVRAERRPLFLQVDCDRLMAHSKGDDDRDPQELAGYWARDPLNVYFDQNPRESAELREHSRRIVEQAVSKAEQASYAELFTDVQHGRVPLRWTAIEPGAEERFVVTVRAALQRNMQRHPRILLIGEDIESPYGGAFKITKGLSEEFPGRVLNTPISEATIVGLGNGLALSGYIPVCEIMFGDFMTLAADQIINHAAKFSHMYNDQVRVPLVIRTPMGGRRGYGPTHSQSLEKHFLGIPQTRVLALNGRYDPGLLYDTLFANVDRPTIVIENKILYATRLGAAAPPGFVLEHSNEVYPTIRLRPVDVAQITVFCYGGMLQYVEQAVVDAFDEYEIAAEVICPTQIYPLDPTAIIESLRQTHLLLVVEEGINFAAAGSELIAQMSELAPGVLRKVVRIGSPHVPIPACGQLEEQFLPGRAHVLAGIQELAGHE